MLDAHTLKNRLVHVLEKLFDIAKVWPLRSKTLGHPLGSWINTVDIPQVGFKICGSWTFLSPISRLYSTSKDNGAVVYHFSWGFLYCKVVALCPCHLAGAPWGGSGGKLTPQLYATLLSILALWRSLWQQKCEPLTCFCSTVGGWNQILWHGCVIFKWH